MAFLRFTATFIAAAFLLGLYAIASLFERKTSDDFARKLTDWDGTPSPPVSVDNLLHDIRSKT